MRRTIYVLLMLILSVFVIRIANASTTQTGSISGSVTEADGGGSIAGAWVYAMDSNFDFVAGAYSQSDGSYQITGLDSGSYYVAISAAGYGGVYYDNGYDDPNATPVNVIEPNDTSGVDFSLSPESTISGQVFEANGTTPISGADVQVWPQNGGQIRSAITAADGSYTVGGLSAGDYVAKAQKNGYAVEYWYEKTSWDDATTLTIGLETSSPGINFTLDQGGNISGVVSERATGNPILGVGICRWDYDTGDNFTCTSTAVDGSYMFGGLTVGDYRIRANQSGYSWQFYNDTTQWDDAERVSVATGQTITEIDFSLDPGGNISGYVYDSDGTTHLANIRTHIVRSNGTGWPACTDSNGYYSFDNVPFDVAWRVEAGGGDNHCGGSELYMKQYWDHTADWNDATTLTLNEQTPSVSDINFSLQPGGSISGSATELDGGAPIAFAWLSVFNTNFDYLFGVHALSDGNYHIMGLAPGNYYLSISASGYGGVYYDNAYDNLLASQISVAAATETSNINFQLSPEAAISGHVFDTDGTTPLSNVEIEVWPENSGQIRSTASTSDGSYTIRGLSTGYYVARARLDGYADEYYDDATSWGTATPISVTQPLDTSGIDFVLEPSGSISGYVHETDGTTPIVGADIWAAGPDAEYVYHATSLLDGSFSILSLPSNTYTVKAYKDGFVWEWYDEQSSHWDADDVIVTAPGDTAGINFTLQLAGSISGHIFKEDGSSVITDALISVHAHGISEGSSSLGTYVSQSNGSYLITGFAPGTYKVQANNNRDPGYVTKYYDNKVTWTAANTIEVLPNQTTTNIDFSLEPGGTITGNIYEADGITPIEGAGVWAAGPDAEYVHHAISEADGSYTITSLPSNPYTLKAYKSGFVWEWWDNHKTGHWDADIVIVNVPDVVPYIDFTLDTAGSGSISGSVTENDGTTPISGASIEVVDTNFNYIGGANSQPDGSFVVTGLFSGDYYVSVEATGYGGVYYDNGYDSPSATLVSVVEPNNTSGINFQLWPEATISGHIYDTDGTSPLSGVRIEVWPENGGHIRNTTSISDGSFRVRDLSTGYYLARVQIDSYADEYYDNATSWSAATPISVTQSLDTSGIDFVLEPSGSISGIVYNHDGTTTVSGRVIAKAADSSIFRAICANNDGTYTISGLPLYDYKVYAYGYCNADPNYVNEYWQEQATWDLADIITLDETSPDLSGIDFTLKLGGEISGRVLLADGVTPVENVCVRVSTTAPEFTLYPRYWRTPSDGSFTLYGVPTTGIYLRTDANCWGDNPELQDEWYASGGSTPDASQAEMILLSSGETITDVIFTLDIAASTTVSPEEGGVLTSTADISTTLAFPPGAVSEPITVTFKITTSLPISTGLVFVGQNFSIKAVTADGTPVTTFSEPFTITINYRDEDVTGLVEENLTLNFWDTETGQWVSIPVTIDTEANTITAVLDHLTDFAIIGKISNQLYLPTILFNP